MYMYLSAFGEAEGVGGCRWRRGSGLLFWLLSRKFHWLDGVASESLEVSSSNGVVSLCPLKRFCPQVICPSAKSDNLPSISF
jgi:hypothetical protein